MLIHAYNGNTQCRTNCMSEKMEKGEEGLRTVECLRGRLLAERHASRTAKEEAEFMTIKIAELEANLKEEIELREKAERRLRFLMKKLESLKGSRNIERSDQSSSAELSAVSCVSSIVSSKENDQEANAEITNPDKNRDSGDLGKDQVSANGHSAEENRNVKLEDIRCGSKTSVASGPSHEEHRFAIFQSSNKLKREDDDDDADQWNRQREDIERKNAQEKRFIEDISQGQKESSNALVLL